MCVVLVDYGHMLSSHWYLYCSEWKAFRSKYSAAVASAVGVGCVLEAGPILEESFVVYS